MIIGCVGFSWSGSSAATDLLREFDENQIYIPEFIFAYYPDSLSDLDFHLNQECSKFLSSTVAIPRFRKIANVLLKKQTNGKIKALTNDYLEKITQVKWLGDCQGQLSVRHPSFYHFFGQRVMIGKIIPRVPYSFSRKMRLYPLKEKEYSIRPNNFIEHTQDYTDAILSSMGFDLDRNIVLDQPFPGNNPTRCMRYFRNSKAIIVDRDPRDMYLSLVKQYKRIAFSVPIDNIEDFVKYYYSMHQTIKEEIKNPNVLYIRLESLIYDYEPTVNRVISFLGLSEHTNPKKYFDPQKSIKNTQLFKKYNDCKKEIQFIEKELSDYLYKFEDFEDVRR